MLPQLTGRMRWLIALAVLALWCESNGARAQTAPGSEHDTDAPLIRVYTSLLQIPVLILDPLLNPVSPIDPGKFAVQLDNLKPFRPRLVRLEGEDPITLAILIDRSHRNSLLPGLADALATLTPDLLGMRDRVVFYATDGCHLRRYGEMLYAQRPLLRAFAEAAVAGDPSDRFIESCTPRWGLWKSAAVVANSLSNESGRRIVLAMTDGIDADREYTADKVRSVATSGGVAIFSIAERGKVPPGPVFASLQSMTSGGGGRRGLGGVPLPASLTRTPSDLSIMSEMSGGMVLETDARKLPATLGRFITLVRGRYIVEFNRPINMSAGRHILTVDIGQPRYFIRAAGTSMPIADPTQLDPSVQHGPLSPRPPDPDQLVPDATPAAGSAR